MNRELTHPNFNSLFRHPCSSKGIDGGKEKGYTLIEMIVVIVILSVVSAMTIKFLIDSLKIYTMTVNQKTLYEEGKLALERMCRDIRNARMIEGTTASSITFIRDDATAQDNAGERIIFQRNAGANTLEKVKASPPTTSTMASHVTAFSVANATNEIDLEITLSQTSGEIVRLRTKVYPKNLARDTTHTYKNFIQNWQEAYQ